MNDCLQLPPHHGGGGTRRLQRWEATWLPLGEGEAEGLAKGAGNDWAPIAVPEQQWAEEEQSAIWYRTVFPRPDVDGRVILRIGGAFLGTNVWLNGRFLGSHYGYFAPFGFDVTPYLRDQNLLVVCCETPIERDLTRKRHVMGIFNDGDSRPYPSSTWFSLPDEYHWKVPVGLWAPVELEYTGPGVLEWAHIRPRVEAGDVGRVELTAHLRNLDGREMSGEVVFDLEPAAGPPLRLRRDLTLAGGSERTVQMALTVTGVGRWLPWRLGPQTLYGARLTVLMRDRTSVRWQDRFGFRDLTVNAGPEGWEVLCGGRPMFLRGANYTPSLQLDQLSEQSFAADLEVARKANLDLLRVPGAVLPEAFYRLCDEAGMLVIADFPLTRSYAYHADAEEARFFEQAVRAQVPEMVGQLSNRPSIVLWMAHDDPPWIEANSALGDVHAVRQNYTIDHEVKATLEMLDATRPALAASGDLDRHLWLGWREGSWHHFADVLPQFVSAFGAQALPPLGSPDWSALKTRWPVSGDDATWLHAGYQSPHWAEHGVGLTEDYDSLEDYVDASHEYQAWLLAYAIDQLRKRKFEPCYGALV
ncbi:MAG: glycosyl hydrolase 2 galactose-binding domain-containing protein, partial [Candidatus Dormibacteraceae bacterium]